MNDTRDRILTKALALFNESGIEYVGMRELAASLDMRIGNVTYYFATKDELVAQLAKQYSDSNSKIHADHPTIGLYAFLKKNELLFKNMIGSRCLMLSMVHIMLRNPIMAAQYDKVQNMRRAGLEQSIRSLCEKNFLKVQSADEHWFMVSANSLINRFWMSEAALSINSLGIEQQAGHYLKLLAYVFMPYATKTGLKELGLFLEELG